MQGGTKSNWRLMGALGCGGILALGAMVQVPVTWAQQPADVLVPAPAGPQLDVFTFPQGPPTPAVPPTPGGPPPAPGTPPGIQAVTVPGHGQLPVGIQLHVQPGFPGGPGGEGVPAMQIGPGGPAGMVPGSGNVLLQNTNPMNAPMLYAPTQPGPNAPGRNPGMPGMPSVSGMPIPVVQEFDPRVHELIQRYKSAEDDEERRRVRQELARVVSDQFERRQNARQQELEAMEKQLKRLRELHERRNEARQDIIRDRLQYLLKQAEGLGWGGAEEAMTQVNGLSIHVENANPNWSDRLQQRPGRERRNPPRREGRGASRGSDRLERQFEELGFRSTEPANFEAPFGREEIPSADGREEPFEESADGRHEEEGDEQEGDEDDLRDDEGENEDEGDNEGDNEDNHEDEGDEDREEEDREEDEQEEDQREEDRPDSERE